MITRYRRPFTRNYHTYHQLVSISGWGGRPCQGGVVTVVPLPVGLPNDQLFMGMDPSNPLTYVRRWNPQPGMIARLNFDGAQAQGETDMGGTWGNPPSQMRSVAVRPKRRPRLWLSGGSVCGTGWPPWAARSSRPRWPPATTR